MIANNMDLEGCLSSSSGGTCFACWAKRRNWKLKSGELPVVVSIMNALDYTLEHTLGHIKWDYAHGGLKEGQSWTFSYSNVQWNAFVCGMFLVVPMRLYSAEARVPFHRWGNSLWEVLTCWQGTKRKL